MMPATCNVMYKAAFIASGGTTSGAIDTEGYAVSGVYVPSAVNGTVFQLHCSYDGLTFRPVYINGSDDVYQMAASKRVPVYPDDYRARFVKVVTGTAQTAERMFVVELSRLG